MSRQIENILAGSWVAVNDANGGCSPCATLTHNPSGQEPSGAAGPGGKSTVVFGAGAGAREMDAHLPGSLELVLESQLPHKTVNLFFWFATVHNKLTILWGS